MSEPDMDLGLKAFAISLARMIAKEPAILQILDEKDNRGHKRDWIELQESLSDPDALARFAINLEKEADKTEWSMLDIAAAKWAEYGWVIGDSLFKLDLWKHIPQTQAEADKICLHYIKRKELIQVWQDTTPVLPNHWNTFREARICFENKCYIACASLLISLIDGTLISSKANNQQENRKTGSVAQKRISDEILKDDTYRLPGLFHWELINLDTYIRLVFERANNFTNEPPRINRNFLHHGMNKRRVLRKDCIKLFLAYKRVLSYCKQ